MSMSSPAEESELQISYRSTAGLSVGKSDFLRQVLVLDLPAPIVISLTLGLSTLFYASDIYYTWMSSSLSLTLQTVDALIKSSS